jgi:SAM-dependent methyltransferase
MLTEEELRTIRSYEEEAKRKEIDDSPLEIDSFETRTFARMRPNGRVVDIGCGHGRVVPLLAELGIARDRYTGVDPSPAQVALGKEIFPDINFVVGDIYSLGDSHPALFDGFWCCCMLMHIPRNRLSEALLSLRRSLKQNAVGIIVTYCGEGELYSEGDDSLFVLYQKKELEEILGQSGFRSSFYNPEPRCLVGSIVAV